MLIAAGKLLRTEPGLDLVHGYHAEMVLARLGTEAPHIIIGRIRLEICVIDHLGKVIKGISGHPDSFHRSNM
jgi:hypothetical protein